MTQPQELPHEVGSRLTVIEGLAEILCEGLGSISGESARQFAGVIARDAGRLRELLGVGQDSSQLEGETREHLRPRACAKGSSPEATVRGRPRVLLADDDPGLRDVVRRCLEARGWVVVQAGDGEDALASGRRHPPDLVVLDVRMPRLDGWEVLTQLKSDPRTRGVPVIMLTSRSGTADVVDGLGRGAHDYLAKPFSPLELCARADAALRVKRLADELRHHNVELGHASRTDWLTTLPNRRHLEERLSELASFARRHEQDLGMIMLDIDDFKRVNDDLGHPAGDAVLRGVAERLRAALRAEDMVGRWGGDEFAILLPGSRLGRSRAVGARLRGVVSKVPMDTGGGCLHTIKISAGCAAGSDAQTLVETADQALYAAKRAGRR